jgi:cell division protein ZapA (FtsZ GTPase activity inhibitor)
MDDKLSIKVNVADRYYPLKVERENEEKIRKAARMINEKVLQYKQRYSDKDVQDFLAMASLQYVIKLTEEEEKQRNDQFPDAIKELIKKIDTVLEEKSDSVL